MASTNDKNTANSNFEVAKRYWQEMNPNFANTIPIGNQPDYTQLFGQFNENLKKKILED